MFNPLKINLLGEIELLREGVAVPLPPSKKCRGLLAYLVTTAKPHRRERLCQLLWDVADDPRGALRWTLSKLRPLVDTPEVPRLLADRDSVRFEPREAQVDWLEVRQALRKNRDRLPTETLEFVAKQFRGEFLEGLDLSDYHDFQAWCIATREEARQTQVRVLQLLVQRHAGAPREALSHARALVACDPLDDAARATLVDLLDRTGHPQEARQHLETGRRLLVEVGESRSEALEDAARRLEKAKPVAPSSWGASASGSSAAPAPMPAAVAPTPGAPVPSAALPTPSEPALASTPLVGREHEKRALHEAIERCAAERRQRVILLRGEPGVGKTRLLQEAKRLVQERRGTVLAGQSFEAEAHRAYGPWIDALTALHPSSVGTTLSSELAPLLPGGDLDKEGRSRDRFFAAVVELLAARAHSAPPVLLLFDDLQWCDEASSELLHYALRMTRHRPVLVLLAARDGELPDNEAIQRMLRGLRREGLLQDSPLAPLDREETMQLVQHVAPEVDGKRVFQESAGNPLFAIEYARSISDTKEPVSTTLSDLVRDRLQRLSSAAAEALQWAAVLGGAAPVRVLEDLMPSDSMALMGGLEGLERHGLLRTDVGVARRGAAYVFSHDLVRRVVYATLSEPRRRLMHLRVAEAYRQRVATDPSLASERARHAARGGDMSTAAECCIAAGRHCLRVFANGDAFRLARKAFRYAESLDESSRLRLQIEAQEVQLAARRPQDVDAESVRVEALAEEALRLGCIEHARLGFHLVSYLRWEKGDWTAARAQTLRAEEVARAGDDRGQVVAMAEAARCLALLERDLVDAEALVLEARSRARQRGIESMAILDALGMLRCHHGEWEEARALFHEARTLARRQGDRMGEFQVLEHLTMLEIEKGSPEGARTLCDDLMRLASKLREGSDEPCARALTALADRSLGKDGEGALAAAIEALRQADAKYRLAFTLTRAAELDLREGEVERARARAEEALAAATAVDHPTEIAMARVVLAQVALRAGDRRACRGQLKFLATLLQHGGTAHARQKAASLMEEFGIEPQDETNHTAGGSA